jgi:hypothetical protein
MKSLKTQLRFASLVSLILLAAAANAQITPGADAYTNTVDPATNYGAKTLLDVDGATQITYIQFNLASIPAGYTGANITQATLKLYVNAVTTAGSFNVDYVNGTWTESTITSDLAPALGTTIAASIPLVAADKNQYILIDVTAAVQAWLSGTTNDGVALVANGTFNASFDSKESTSTSHAPELDIVFAGGGTLTGVTTASGSGLTGGGTSGTLNLGLLTTCASGQVLEWNGSAWACATVSGSGTITGVTTSTSSGLSGGGTSGTLTWQVNPAVVPLLAAANTFTTNQAVTGNLAATGTVSGASFQIGSSLFAYGSATAFDAFLGFAGNSTTAGTYNTGVGYQALFANTGNENTASGYQALFSNTTGNGNTAYGWSALYTNTGSGANTAVGSGALENNAGTAADGGNTAVGYLALKTNTTGYTNTAIGYSSGQTSDSSSVTGSRNTLLGASAALSTGTLSNATAIGANAVVAASNALVLGSTGTSVGIGTSTPAYTLDVHGTGNFTGAVTFASGQSFPGTGTITGITTASGSGLSGGGTTGTLSLKVPAAGITNAMLANSSLTVGAGTGLTGGGSVALGGSTTPLSVDTTKVPLLAAANTFTNPQTIAVGSATDLPLAMSSSSTSGTWMSLANASTGGGTWNVISAGSGNGEGAGNLVFQPFNAASTLWTHSKLNVDGAVAIGGDLPMSKNPRMVFSGFISSFGNGSGLQVCCAGYFIPDKNITITRVTAAIGSPGSNCSTPAVVQVQTVGTTAVFADVTLANGASTADSGPISVTAAIASDIVITGYAADNCTAITGQSPGNVFINVEYAMQ